MASAPHLGRTIGGPHKYVKGVPHPGAGLVALVHRKRQRKELCDLHSVKVRYDEEFTERKRTVCRRSSNKRPRAEKPQHR